VTVGLLHALFAYQGPAGDGRGAGRRRAPLEIDRCRSRSESRTSTRRPSGDLRHSFRPWRSRVVDQLKLTSPIRRQHPGRLLLFYTGTTRSADTILSEQTANISEPSSAVAPVADLRRRGRKRPARRRRQCLGAALNKSWQAKRALASGVSNSEIDEAVDASLAAGATGAKVTGAGGGGFLLVVCPGRVSVQYGKVGPHEGTANQHRAIRVAGSSQHSPRHLGVSMPMTDTGRESLGVGGGPSVG